MLKCFKKVQIQYNVIVLHSLILIIVYNRLHKNLVDVLERRIVIRNRLYIVQCKFIRFNKILIIKQFMIINNLMKTLQMMLLKVIDYNFLKTN